MKIGIIGCGWLGIKIAEHFKTENQIFVTTTSTAKELEIKAKGLNSFVMRFSEQEVFQEGKPWEIINALDIVIITVPFSKMASITQLKNRFSNLCLFIKGFEKQIFLMSSIGIYPQCELELKETTLSQDALEPSIYYVEELMKNKYPQINILRLGGLMGADRVFSNYEVSNLNQIVNHIHYEDICNIIERMIQLNTAGKTYNVVAPLYPTKSEVIHFQKGQKGNETTEKPFGRKVLSELLQTELQYHFIRPNPIAFHLK